MHFLACAGIARSCLYRLFYGLLCNLLCSLLCRLLWSLLLSFPLVQRGKFTLDNILPEDSLSRCFDIAVCKELQESLRWHSDVTRNVIGSGLETQLREQVQVFEDAISSKYQRKDRRSSAPQLGMQYEIRAGQDRYA